MCFPGCWHAREWETQHKVITLSFCGGAIHSQPNRDDMEQSVHLTCAHHGVNIYSLNQTSTLWTAGQRLPQRIEINKNMEVWECVLNMLSAWRPSLFVQHKHVLMSAGTRMFKEGPGWPEVTWGCATAHVWQKQTLNTFFLLFKKHIFFKMMHQRWTFWLCTNP